MSTKRNKCIGTTIADTAYLPNKCLSGVKLVIAAAK